MVTMSVVCVTGRMLSLVQSTSRRDYRLSRPQSSITSVSGRHFMEEREEGREEGRKEEREKRVFERCAKYPELLE